MALKIWRAEHSTSQGRPGEILEITPAGVVLACGEDALLLTELQKPGGKRLAAAEFLKGYPLAPGQQFEVDS
jgi:methionyl-tRNA formyltransferase